MNPILPGFNPDPSIIRVADDYYIATSTFEWFPGVQIHHSRDLINWSLIHRPLDRRSQLEMLGNPDSGGVWAPCLSHADGLFYLVYSNVKGLRHRYKISRNFLVISDRIDADWSDPIPLHASGFDHSLFHDKDGRKFLTWLVWDDRPGNNPFYGIMLQEVDLASKSLVGSPTRIFTGTELGCTEGPHLYQRNGYYYLLTAEGGTGWDHAVTLARSRKLQGPYEVCPHNPILTSKGKHNASLKRAGHADLVETPDGKCFLVHLCSRPIPHRGTSTMGRETAIQSVIWTEDDWLALADGSNQPSTTFACIQNPTTPHNRSQHYTFESPTLHIDFQTRRIPLEQTHLSLTDRPGYLRLKGDGPLCSRFEQSLVARRQQAHRFTATTALEHAPDSFLQNAGLTYFYSSESYYAALVTRHETLGRVLVLLGAQNEKHYQSFAEPIPIPSEGPVFLRLTVDFEDAQFSYSPDGETWTPLGRVLDASFLSDESAGAHENFTGSFVGLCCQDLTGAGHPADFAFLDYQERGNALAPGP